MSKNMVVPVAAAAAAVVVVVVQTRGICLDQCLIIRPRLDMVHKNIPSDIACYLLNIMTVTTALTKRRPIYG